MKSIVFALVLTGLCQALAEETSNDAHARVPRTLLLKKKLCFTLGVCGGGGGHHNGGYGGYQNHQGGYSYPPINIGISQSQSSSNAGGGGFGTGYYPNNYQFNTGYPNHGYGGYSSYGQRPGYFDNGYGSSNNQFNGNYYNGGNGYPNGGHGGYRGKIGNFFDEGEDTKPIYEDNNESGPNYDVFYREHSDEAYRSDQ